MKKNHIYLLISILVFFAYKGFGQTTQKRILVIYSYDATSHIYQESKKALKEVFPLNKYHIDVEFLDSKQYPDGQLYQSVNERIKIKQKKQSNYDIIIACNDNSLNFCLKNQHKLFNKTPIIFWGVNDLNKAFQQDKNDWITGIAQNISLDKTLNLIKKLHPAKKNLQVITDNTTTGLADYNGFVELIKQFPEYTYHVINSSEYTLASYTKRLQQIPPDDLILLLSSYRTKDTYLGLAKINEIFCSNTSNIIYNAYKYGVGQGYMGGMDINYYDNMYSACVIAKQVLTGTDVKYLKVLLDHPAINIIDYDQLIKNRIDIASVPKSAILINMPLDNWDISKKELFKILSILLVLFIFLSLLIYLINARRKTEKANRLFAENYLNIFNENHSMMLLIEADTQKITDSNKAAARFYGYTQKEFKNLFFYDLCKLPQMDIDAFFIQSLKQNSHFEQKHKTKSGLIREVEIHSGRMTMGKITYIYAIIHDISNRIEAENELIDAKKRAEESDRLKSAFLANMSHEIRTPMNSIIGFSSLLEDPNLSDKMRHEFVRHIQSSGDHLLNLINDIIDISKIEANELKVSLKDINLNQLLDDIFVLLKKQITNSSKNEIQLLLQKGINKPEFIIKTDEVRLKQILLNLLNNAFKFTDSGSIEFGYKYREDSVIQFYVKDTGIGIPKDKQQQIFSAFQQIEEYASRNHGGAGLGLSITRSLVEKLGGHIWVMSEPGDGSRFYFTHPGRENKLNI